MFGRTHNEEPAIPETMEEKMDVIILHLERMDRRDRVRMWGGIAHSLLAIIPMLFFLWSAWYLYEHGDELIGAMMQQTAQNAAQSTGQSYEEVMRQIREAFGAPAAE